MDLPIKSFPLRLMSLHHLLLLIFQLLDGSRGLGKQLTLFVEGLFQRLIFHFKLDVGLDDVSRVRPAERLADALLQQEHAQFQVEIFMLKLLQLFLVFLDAPSARRRRDAARRSMCLCGKEKWVSPCPVN